MAAAGLTKLALRYSGSKDHKRLVTIWTIEDSDISLGGTK